MATVASKVPFYQLCHLLDDISKRSGTDAKKQLLRGFVEEWRDFHLKLHKDDPNTVRLFPDKSCRLTYPQIGPENRGQPPLKIPNYFPHPVSLMSQLEAQIATNPPPRMGTDHSDC